jgi:hypothetical protein
MFRKLVPMLSLSALAVASFGASPAAAQQFDAGPPPPYAVGAPDPTFMGRYHLRGFVRAFDHFNMTLGIHHQGVPVQLHQGTIIHPTGLTISPGMFLRVDGYFSGGVFYADKIVLER